MLATRSLRLASIRYGYSYHYAWSSSTRTLPVLQPRIMAWISSPFAVNYSKDAKAAESASNLCETSLKSKNPQTTPECSNESLSSITKTNKYTKTKDEECSTGAVADFGVKLPSKDQVESFLFKSLVYFWDFAYYVFCLCRKLFDTYVVKNATVQTNWRLLLKRMEDARKDIKSK